MSDTAKFYDDLTEDYHLIFPDWEESMRRQGETLGKLLKAEAPDVQTVLDCSCGIGTQAIGLALKDYRVHGTDISHREVERARREAKKAGAKVSFGVADFRSLEKDVKGTFDAVLSCDNSLPHLLTDEDIHKALQNMKSKLTKDGILLVSIRDYDALTKEKPKVTTPFFHQGDEKAVTFQVWDWDETQPVYKLTFFTLRELNGSWTLSNREASYRAVRRQELTRLLEETGFSDIKWHMPDQSGYYQPVVTARNRLT